MSTPMTWLLLALCVLALVGTFMAFRAAAAAVRMAQAAIACAHQHTEGPPVEPTVVLYTANGHAIPTPDQAPDTEIDVEGAEWLKHFGPPESWGPWEEQR